MVVMGAKAAIGVKGGGTNGAITKTIHHLARFFLA